MSLEKFLRTHAASFERKPWLSLEEQAEEFLEDARNTVEEERIDEAYDEGYDAAVCNHNYEVKKVLRDKSLSDAEKLSAIEELCK